MKCNWLLFILIPVMISTASSKENSDFDSTLTTASISLLIGDTNQGIDFVGLNLRYQFIGLGLGWTSNGGLAPDPDAEAQPMGPEGVDLDYEGDYFYITGQGWLDLDFLPFESAIMGELGYAKREILTLTYFGHLQSIPYSWSYKYQFVYGCGIEIYPLKFLALGLNYNNITKFKISIGYHFNSYTYYRK